MGLHNMHITVPKITVKLNEILFFMAYGLYMIVSILRISFYAVYIQGLFKYAFLLCLGLLVLKEIYGSKYSLKTVAGAIVAFGLLLIINNSLDGMIQFGTSIVLIYCARDIPLKKILKVTVWLSSILFVFIVLSAYAGIIENYAYVSSSRTRYYMGFRYALYGPTVLSNIIMCDIYLHKERISNWKLLLFAIVDYLCFTQTDSRLTFGLTLLIILAALILKYKPQILKKRKVICLVMANSWWLCAGLSFWIIGKYNSEVAWMNKLDIMLGSRLSLGLSSLQKYGISLFGNSAITWVGNGLDIYGNQSTETYLYVDNMYLQLLQRFGIIFFAVFVILFTVVCYKYLKRKDYHMLVILFVLALHGIIDDLIMYLYYNTFLLVAGIALLETARSSASRRIKDTTVMAGKGSICKDASEREEVI